MVRWWVSLAWVKWVVVWRLVSGVVEIDVELWWLCVVGVEQWKSAWSWVWGLGAVCGFVGGSNGDFFKMGYVGFWFSLN